VACGYRWLCGPYGTGFTWLSEPLLDQLQPQQAYWLAMQAGRGLSQMRETKLRDDLGVRAFDTFCTAAFANTLPWAASLELLLSVGIDQIAAFDQRLVDRLIAGLDPDQVELISPADGPARSTLAVISVRSGDTEAIHQQLTDAGVDTAFREGNLRFSVHLFNTDDQVDRGLQILARSSSRMPKQGGPRTAYLTGK
jgi:cysteine desulfurase/selenocysteine lyase